MSRATTAVDPKQRGMAQGDRRDAAAPRVQYEALVEVGAGSTGGFEAESIDVSPDGIRLRTAYLPEAGERLVCRFDGFGGEIVAEGEVIWRREQGRGGEFGVRFVGLDERGAKLLEAMCQPEDPAEPAAEPSEPNAFVGSRVKLHIQGLGSPMRARVKDTARGEVLVGSSLEFLKVGRDVELEDVEQGKRRLALIEHVGVEIDPDNSVPQLVVALRYDGAAKDELPEPVEEHSTAPYRNKMKQAMVETKPAKETTPEPTVIDNDDESPDRAAMAPGDDEPMAADAAEPASAAADGEPSGDAADAEEDGAKGKLGEAGRSIGAFARKLAPKLATAGTSAKSAFGNMLDAVRRKREERKLERSAKAPKRTTAPPPSGALRSDGRRLFREQNDEPADAEGAEMEIPKRDYKKKAVIGSVIGAIAVVAMYAGASQMSKGKSPDRAFAAAAAASAEPAAPAAADAPAPGGPVATANVPLFGATPLSTTEAVPAPPNPEALADDDSEAGGAAAKDAKSAPGQLQKEWGVGKVTDPITLKITMDDNIAGFTGAEGATGFTLVVPGRKTASSASGLARKDKRIESINVVNYPDRTEVTVHFKGEVPAYSAKANGKKLILEIDGKKGKAGDDGDDTKKKKNKGAKHKKHGDPKMDKAAPAADAGAKADKKADVKKLDPKKSDKKDSKKAKKG